MNIKQKPKEKIRPFLVGLRVTSRKYDLQGEVLDNMFVNYLKNSCVPFVSSPLNIFLLSKAINTIVEHAIQFESRQGLLE